MRKRAIALVWLVLLMGCAPVAQETRDTANVPVPFDYRLGVRFTSDVADLYYVTSGPAESYRRFRVNDRLRGELEAYARRGSNPAASRAAQLDVHLLGVTTNYREYGAGRLGFGSIRRAHWTWSEWDNDVSIPAEITKQVALRFTVELRTDERTVRADNVKSEAEEVVDRDHWDPHWAYDYSEVMQAAIRNAVAAVDRIARDALR